MISRRKLIILLSVIALGWSCAPAKDAGTGSLAVSSPDGSLAIALSLEAKPQPYLAGERVYYRVTYKGTPVLTESPLGLDIRGADPLDKDLEVVK